MRQAHLSFATACFALSAPPEVLAEAERMYPSCLTTDPVAEAGEPVARFRIERLGEVYRLTGEGIGPHEARRPLEAALGLGLELERALLRARGARLAIHAGAVAGAGGACLLAGDAEAGKTSCTFQLVELGCDFLCEEIAVLDRTGHVYPFPQVLALNRGFLEDYSASFEVTAGTIWNESPATIRYRPRRRRSRPTPVTTLLFPRYRPGLPGSLNRRTAADALTELLGYCFEPLDDEEAYFDRAMRLLEQVDVFDLAYPDAATARRLLAGAFPGGAA